MKLWRGQPDNWVYRPSRADKGRFWLGLACVFYVLAVVESTSSSASALGGRWAWLHQMATAVFGPRGDMILFTFIGTACVAAGALYLRTPR
jgi:hypothetical protein